MGFCGTIKRQSRYPQISREELLRCIGLGSLGLGSIEENQQHLNAAAVQTQGTRLKLVHEPERYWEFVTGRHRTTYDNLCNRLRKIEREFRSVELTFAYKEPRQLLDLLISEKQEQYRRKGEDLRSTSWMPRCLEHIMRHGEGGCVPVLLTLMLDGEWAALHLGVRAGPVLHYWLPVYNRKFRSLSPGLVLLYELIEEAGAKNITEIDFGGQVARI